MREEIPVFNPHQTNLPAFEMPSAYLGRRWGTLRKRHLMRSPACVACGLAGEEVHHILPRCTHPEQRFNPLNLKTLCRRCHAKEHGKKLSTSYPHFRDRR